MKGLILKKVEGVLGRFSPELKGIIALFTFLGIYIKDSKMLNSIFKDLAPYLGLSNIEILVASITIPSIIIAAEIIGAELHHKKERKYLVILIEIISLGMIGVVTFGKSIILKVFLGTDISNFFVISVKCAVLALLIFIAHEVFLYAYAASKERCVRLLKVSWYRNTKKLEQGLTYSLSENGRFQSVYCWTNASVGFAKHSFALVSVGKLIAYASSVVLFIDLN